MVSDRDSSLCLPRTIRMFAFISNRRSQGGTASTGKRQNEMVKDYLTPETERITPNR